MTSSCKPISYCAWLQDRSPWFRGIAKLDMETGQRAACWAPPGHHPSEAIFVPRPGDTAEDDGVLLSVVLNGEFSQFKRVEFDTLQ